MKNLQKGFVVPVLLTIITLLVVGGGVYIYQSKKVETPSVKNTDTPQLNQVQQTNAQTPAVTQPIVTSAAVSTKPSITVLSPNGGETFKQNSPITVKWSQNFSGSAFICLMGDAGCVYSSTPVKFNSGINTLTIPVGINIATCNTTICYIADGFKVRVTTDNQPGSGHAGEFMNDESNGYFVILPQTGLQAFSFLQEMQSQIGTNYTINPSVGSTIPAFRVDLPSDKFAQATNYLSSQFGGHNNKYTSERGYGYENWHLLCMSIGLGAGAASSDLPYVTCKDKVGVQTIDVVVKDIKGINTNPRDFLLTIGNETMKVRMPAVIQNNNYQNGTYADFVKTITSNQYQTSTFKMTGEIKGDAFEVTTIQWILG
ncbi:MAG: hypothetical protein WC648_02260 [Candidatus Paceibacterota bacterium]|jgi:hypothetical protein